ncbi:MAG TPA: CBS domain-containing protein [Terriglobales bacterium]|nr:CBS domain-containing protein [Terriglobales bacterium]
MSILHLCDEVPAKVNPETTIADAINLMIASRVGAVAVVDRDNKVAGIFTERDVLKKFALSGKNPQKTEIREFMNTPVMMATVHTSAGEALEVMVDKHIRHLPVVDDQTRLLGILSIRNLLQSQVDELRQELDSLETALTNDAAGG